MIYFIYILPSYIGFSSFKVKYDHLGLLLICSTILILRLALKLLVDKLNFSTVAASHVPYKNPYKKCILESNPYARQPQGLNALIRISSLEEGGGIYLS